LRGDSPPQPPQHLAPVPRGVPPGLHVSRSGMPVAGLGAQDEGVQDALARLEQICPLGAVVAQIQAGQSIAPKAGEGPWEIIPGELWLGTSTHATSRENIQQRRIGAVVNATDHDMRHLGVCQRYMFLGIKDNAEENLLAAFERARPFLEQAAAARAPILIHCAFGLNRSAALCVLWLMRHFKFTLCRAFEHVMRNRTHPVVLNFTFRQALAVYAVRHGCVG